MTVGDTKAAALVLVFVAICGMIPAAVAGQEAGAGLSVFIPAPLLGGGEGSLAFEQSLDSELSFGGGLSLPFGLSYRLVDGFALSSAELRGIPEPAFFGDSLQVQAGLGYRLGLGFIRIGLKGGGVAAWSFRLVPYGSCLEEGLAEGASIAALRLSRHPGLGWFAGAEAGVRLGAAGIDLGLTWKDVRMPLGIELDWDGDGTGSAPLQSLTSEATLILRGLSCRVGGSFRF